MASKYQSGIKFDYKLNEKIRWGIIGPGSIANNFADALKQSYSGELTAIASLNDKGEIIFGDKYNIQNEFKI